MPNSISGNTGLAEAIVILGGAATSTIVADGSGNYTFSGLAAGVYVVLCQAGGYTFSPNGSKQTIVSTNITGVNFTPTAITPLGTWTKQGVVVSNSNSAFEPCVIFEGNAQILSGNVFKMWYLGGGYVAGGINYAESVDGITWTQYGSNPVIGSRVSGRVFKHNGTYYGYYTNLAFTHIDQFTSADGVNWTLAHTAVLSTGSAGAWDDQEIYNMQIVQVVNGTWTAVYGGNQANNILSTGLATSPDGITWTKEATNPVMYNFASANVTKVDGIYWAWGDSTQYNQLGMKVFEFPTNFCRASSIDLLTWMVPVPSLRPSLPWESSIVNEYQLDSPAVLQVGSQTYMWYWASSTAGSGTGGQIGLAIANATLSQLVTAPAEGVIGTAFTLVQEVDNFAFPSSALMTLAFGSNVTADNLILTWCELGSASAQPTDTQSNVYTKITSLVGGYGSVHLYAAIAKTTGANTITWSSLGSSIPFPGGQAAEFSGGLRCVNHIATNSATGTALSVDLYAEIGDLVFGCWNIGSTTVTPNAGWSPLNGNSSAQLANAMYKIAAASAGLFSPAETASSSHAWAGLGVSFPKGLPAYTFTSNFNWWTPQGIVIPAISGDSPEQPTVLYESTPHILSANPDGKIFKMWFTTGPAATPIGVNYAESNDGVAWTRYGSNPVMALRWGNRIYKNGSTYYAYNSAGFGLNMKISVYTSTDGLSWTLAQANAIVKDANPWDSFGVCQLNIVDIVAGTWYGYYAGTDNSTEWSMGLATSTDGITWTPGGSNPVITSMSPSNFVWQKVGGIYYGWSQVVLANYPGSNYQLPSDIVRYSSSSPTGPWTPISAATYYRTVASEGVNITGANGGQVADPCLISALGNLYLYYTASDNGGSGNNYTLNAAIAFSTGFAQLVASPEGVLNVPISGNLSANLNVLASDNFTRANENPIAGNWSQRFVGTSWCAAQIVSNVVESTVAGSNGDSYWNALTWNNNQWAQITVGAMSASSFVGVNLRGSLNSADNTAYRLYWNGNTGSSGTWAFQKYVSGVQTTLKTGTLTVNIGDTLTGVVIGTNLMLYWNNLLLAIVSDSSISAGVPGFMIAPITSVANAKITAWSGGNFIASAPIPPPTPGIARPVFFILG